MVRSSLKSSQEATLLVCKSPSQSVKLCDFYSMRCLCCTLMYFFRSFRFIGLVCHEFEITKVERMLTFSIKSGNSLQCINNSCWKMASYFWSKLRMKVLRRKSAKGSPLLLAWPPKTPLIIDFSSTNKFSGISMSVRRILSTPNLFRIISRFSV